MEKGFKELAMEKQGNQPRWARVAAPEVGSQRPFESHTLNQNMCKIYIKRDAFWQSCVFWFMFPPVHLVKAGIHRSSLLCWVELNPQPMFEPLITWTYEQYLFVLSFVCCETVIMGRCATELDPSHPSELQSTLRQPPRFQLHVACATLPPNVFILQVYLVRPQWCSDQTMSQYREVVHWIFAFIKLANPPWMHFTCPICQHMGCVYLHACIHYVYISIYFFFYFKKSRKKETNRKPALENVDAYDGDVFNAKLCRP